MLYRAQWLVIFGAALLSSSAGLVLLIPLGLVVSELVVYPLALFVAALLAALSATWTQRALAGAGPPARLWPVLGLTEAGAAMLVALWFAAVALNVVVWGPVIVSALASSLVLALSATAAAFTCRGPADAEQDDKRTTLGLLVLALLSVPVVLFAASLFGLAGA